jgi:hypothetical protein
MTAAQLSPEQAKSIGDLLKSTREQQGRNISDVAYQIALSPAQLRAIEAADLRPFYSHSFFYQAAERYAKFLNISLPARGSEKQENLFVRDTPAAAHPVSTQSSMGDRVIQPSVERSVEESAKESVEESVKESVEVRHVNHGDVAASQPAHTFQPQQHSATQPATIHARKATPSRKLPAFALVAIVAAVAITLVVDRDPVPLAMPDTTESATNTSAATPTATQATTPPASTTAQSTASQGQSPSAIAAASAASNPAATAAVSARPTDTGDKPDSSLESTTIAWVQIVKKNGDKSNLRVEPGQKIEFASANTAAIVFGQPEKAKLVIKGKSVDTNRFVTPDNPSRALVILNQIP